LLVLRGGILQLFCQQVTTLAKRLQLLLGLCQLSCELPVVVVKLLDATLELD
jgi:hypothetical protein